MTPYQCIVALSAMRGRNRASWTSAYSEWQRLVRTLSRGAVTPSAGKPFFLADVLREEVVEEMQATLASRASDIVQVVVDRIETSLPLDDAEAVLASHESGEWLAKLGEADRIVIGYVRTSLGNRAVSELRKGWRHAEAELRRAGATAPAQSHDDGDVAAGHEADEALARAKDALEAAMTRVIEAAPPRYRDAYREQCTDLKALAEGSITMEAVVLRELSREDPVIDRDTTMHIAAIGAALDALSPSADADDLRERAAARDARRVLDHTTRNRDRLLDVQREAGTAAEAVGALLAAVGDFEAYSKERWRSPAGNRTAERVYKAHERMRSALSAALAALCDERRVEAEDAAIAARIIAEVFTRRQKRARRASLGLRGSHGN